MAAHQTAFTEFLNAHGVKHLSNLVTSLKLGHLMALKLNAGQLAPNHPHIPRIASFLKVTPEELAPFCQGEPLAETQVMRLTTKLANKKPGNRVMVHPTQSTKAKKAALRKAAPHGGERNSLKRQNVNLREAVRGMLTTTNIAVMKGDRYVPNMPTEALYLVLNDYAQRRGIKTAVVLDPKFAELFD